MKSKQHIITQAEYTKKLTDLSVLYPKSEHATFKKIYSDSSTVSKLSKDTWSYKRLKHKIASHTPHVLRKVARKAYIDAKLITTKTASNNSPRRRTLSLVEIENALKEHSASPVVSIVVPVYNNLDYTKRCIISLAIQKTKYSFKVVIADDKSTDETEQYFSKLKNIQYIRNSENLGFLLSCNSAIEKVNTKYTVLLNNDTEVLDGWLDGLIDPLENDRKVGIVGSKLIYGDGILQEAGGILFSDGNAWNYGNGKDPGEFEYNYMKEVDYVTGASMAFSTKVFKELGCFDEDLAPAYYEDVDIAMTMRQHGLKVIYNPASSLTHHEGRSMGTDTTVGLKVYQAINKEKILKKWRKVLEKEHYRGPEDILSARERGNTKRVLVVDIHVPFPDRDAGSLRMHGILMALRELGYQVTFWPDTHCPLDRYTKDLQSRGVEVTYGTISFEEFIEARAEYYDSVILSRPIVAPRYLPLLQKFSPETKKIFDTVDLHYIRLSRQAELEENIPLQELADNWKIIEYYLMQNTDTTLVVSEYEKKELRKEVPEVNVEIVSLIHSLKLEGRKKYEERKDLFFIGSYNHLPNKDGLAWFSQEVWPLVSKKLPGIHLTLAGYNMPQDLFDEEVSNITIQGFVEDPAFYFQNSRVFIAPLRFGAGAKGKIVQAMEYGLPVVTTTVGAEGMYLEDGKSVLVADSPEGFAQKIYDLYTEKGLWNRISKNSGLVLQDHFSEEVARKKLKEIV